MAICGDGIIAGNEECDDENLIDSKILFGQIYFIDDGCSSIC